MKRILFRLFTVFALILSTTCCAQTVLSSQTPSDAAVSVTPTVSAPLPSPSDSPNSDTDTDTTADTSKNSSMESFHDTFLVLIGAVATGVVSLILAFLNGRKSAKQKEKHSATILYYDLLSIEGFIKDTANNGISNDIRYFDDWIQEIAFCPHLSSDDVEYLFKIYDCIFDCNYYLKMSYQNLNNDYVVTLNYFANKKRDTLDELFFQESKEENNNWHRLKENLKKIAKIS